MDEDGDIVQRDIHSETLEKQNKLIELYEAFEEFIDKYGWVSE